MLGLKTFSMLGRVVTVLQVSRPPIANDTPRYWLLVWKRFGASAPEIVGYFQRFSLLESLHNLWTRWRCLRELPRLKYQPAVICWHWNKPAVIFAKVTGCLTNRHRELNRRYFKSGLLTLLALVHFFLDIYMENPNISFCIGFWSHRWPKFCIWNVPGTLSEICPPRGKAVQGGGRLPCSSYLLIDQVTSPHHRHHHQLLALVTTPSAALYWRRKMVDYIFNSSYDSKPLRIWNYVYNEVVRLTCQDIYYCCWRWCWLTNWLFIWTLTG